MKRAVTSEETQRVLDDRRFGKRARDWMVRHCPWPGTTMFTSDDYPRVLEALGLIERRGSGERMIGHTHELLVTPLGGAVAFKLVVYALAEMTHEQQHDLIQRRPGPSVRRRPFCYQERGQWRRTEFGDRIVSLIVQDLGNEIVSCWSPRDIDDRRRTGESP